MARTSVDAQLEKLKRQRELLDAKERALLSRANDKAIAQIVDLAKKHKITIEELTSALGKAKSTRTAKAPTTTKKTPAKRAKVAAKWRNPADPTQTWTGRGKSPLWAQAMKAAGTLETALIAND